MNKEKLISVFTELGLRLQSMSEDDKMRWRKEAEVFNKWFTEANVDKALEGIVFMLRKDNLEQWLSNYSIPIVNPKKIGVVMAGNIPLVGFHDLLCVLLSGNTLLAKLSTDDSVLMKKIIALIISIEPEFENRIIIVDRLNDIDALIATGSDNTAKHFDYYFSKIPKIIRRNRVSVAVLTGEETPEQLAFLGADMLQYFGLGCRNVSKIFMPKDMTINRIFEAIEPWKHVADALKYGNNYDYNRSVFLLKSILHLDNGFMLAIESEELVSAIAVFYYEKYNSIDEVKSKLKLNEDKIQCVVSLKGVIENAQEFGSAQLPCPWDYADGVDTLDFLIHL